MPKVTDSLRNAQILADFSYLDVSAPPGHPTNPDYFRRHHPDFAPKGWWDEPIGARVNAYFQDREEAARNVIKNYVQDAQERNVPVDVINGQVRDLRGLYPRKPTKQWQVTQASLWVWWGQGFKDDIMSLVTLLDSIFDPDPHANFSRIAEWSVRQMHPEGVPEGVAIELPGRSITSQSNLREGYMPMQASIVYLFENSWRARFCAECKKRFVAAEPKNKFCSDTCSRKYRNEHKAEWFSKYDKAMRKKYGKSWRRKKYGKSSTVKHSEGAK